MNQLTKTSITTIILVLVGIVEAQTTTATTQPATQSAVAGRITRQIPPLASLAAEKEGKSADDRVNQLIAAHNAKLRNVIDVNLSGQCIWFKVGKPRPISIAFDIATQTGQLTCGPNECTVEHDVVSMKKDSAMQVDALYFLMFRTFDPASFTKSSDAKLKIDDQEIDCILLDGPSESLWLSAKTGNPVRLLASIGDARFTIDYDSKNPWPAPIVPLQMTITLPTGWFGFKLAPTDIPQIRLEVDPTTLQVTQSQEKP